MADTPKTGKGRRDIAGGVAGMKKNAGLWSDLPGSLFPTDTRNSEKTKAEPVLSWKPTAATSDTMAANAAQNIENNFMSGNTPKPESSGGSLFSDNAWDKKDSESDEASDISIDPPKGAEVPDPPKPAIETAAEKRKRMITEDNVKFNEESKSIGSDLYDEINKAKAVYQTSKDRESSKQMWEGIIQGVAHLVAGVVGHQTGLNLGGLKFDKTDWDRRRDQIQNELESTKRDAYQKMGEAHRRLADKRAESAQGYAISKGETELATAKEQGDRRLDISEGQLGEKEKSNRIAAFKALKDDDNGTKEQKIKDYNRVVNNIDETLKAFEKDPSEASASTLTKQIKEANALARSWGIPPSYPDNFNATEKGALYGINPKDIGAINAELSDFTASGQPNTKASKPIAGDTFTGKYHHSGKPIYQKPDGSKEAY